VYPHAITFAGARLAVWDLAFLAGAAAGYLVLRAAFAAAGDETRPRLLPLRYLLTVYACALGAQLFAYAVDRDTSLLPPAGVPWLRYYLDPLYGPKTLYGAVLVLPVALRLAMLGDERSASTALDRWTPATTAVLAFSRLVCFLQGCCYGVRSDLFGVVFPPGSPAHAAGRLSGGPDGLAVPVLPVQLLEAAALAVLSVRSLGALRRGRSQIFLPTVASYSVFRFLVEFVRADAERGLLGPLTPSQWVAVGVLALYATWRLSLQRPRTALSAGSPR
jgi:prolipoprotein diacylglyceryltransferase